MEAIPQYAIQEPFALSRDHFGEEALCPFCETPMAVLDDQGMVVCPNDICAYVVASDVYAVTNTLIEIGRDPLAAAQIARSYVATEPEEITPDRFSIDDEIKANWVLKQMADAQRRIDGVQAMIDDEIAAIRRRGDEIMKPLQGRVQFFTAAFGANLAEWTREELAGSKKKSIALLHGMVGYRKSPDRFVIADEPRAVEWALDNDCEGAVEYKLRKTEFRKHYISNLEAHPELAEIAQIEAGEDEFYVKPESPVQ